MSSASVDAARANSSSVAGSSSGQAEHAQTVVELVEPLAVSASDPYSLEQRRHLRAVEVRRVVVLDRVAVALLPVPDEVGVERGRPRHAALLEREPQRPGSAGARRR